MKLTREYRDLAVMGVQAKILQESTRHELEITRLKATLRTLLGPGLIKVVVKKARKPAKRKKLHWSKTPEGRAKMSKLMVQRWKKNRKGMLAAVRDNAKKGVRGASKKQ